MTPRHLLEPSRLAGGALLGVQSDSRLVDMTRAGNDRAFEAIVARYKGVLLRYCSRMLPDGRGEDAVQQVFVNAYGALHRETTPLSLRSWLFSIAHNVSLNILRQRGSDHEPLEPDSGTTEPTHATIERREHFREVLAAVAALPPGQRDAIVLRELEGRGHDEIARELGVTGGAARQLISRARNGIRQAAAAVLPMPLLMRLTGGTAPVPTAERLAELTAVGGGATLAKVVATGAVGATLLGSAISGSDLVKGDKEPGRADVAEAATPPQDEDTAGDATEASGDDTDGAGDGRRLSGDRKGRDGGQSDARVETDSASGPGSGDREHGELEEGDDDHSGPGGGELDDDHSGPGGGGDDPDGDDHSGPDGGGELEDDHSGPGGGDEVDELEGELEEPVQEDNSGPGSGSDDTSDSSGPGSGDDDETSETDSSGSGSSGPD